MAILAVEQVALMRKLMQKYSKIVKILKSDWKRTVVESFR
jgi:hypothetical protein